METLKEYWELYKRDLKTSVREISYDCFTTGIEKNFEKAPWLLEKEIAEITKEDMLKVKEIMINHYSNATVYRFLTLIHRLMKRAITDKIINNNILLKIYNI